MVYTNDNQPDIQTILSPHITNVELAHNISLRGELMRSYNTVADSQIIVVSDALNKINPIIVRQLKDIEWER